MELPKELAGPYNQTIKIIDGFMKCLGFCVMDTGRNPDFVNSHLLYILSDDYLEALVAVPMMVKQGIHRPAIRDSRFILEMSIKMAYIQQNEDELPIEDKLEIFKKELSSPSISLMKKIDFFHFDDDIRTKFLVETGRVFGYSSKYVHLSPEQISSRISLIESGRSIGKESAEDLMELNSFLEKIYASSIIFIMHSVPSYITGDWLVESDGSSNDWYFSSSQFIAAVDQKFDYKHERQSQLDEIIKKRNNKIKF